jgi:uncharacterized protein YjiS (DUF1127 family)
MKAIDATFRTVFTGWMRAWRALRAHRRVRTTPLDVQALSPHWLSDLNLHGTSDGGLHAQKAWAEYERYRDWCGPR